MAAEEQIRNYALLLWEKAGKPAAAGRTKAEIE
jgi:hypothetical protein